MKKFKLIGCEVFLRESCLATAQSKNTIDPEFTPKAAHEDAQNLKDMIQKKIDEVEKTDVYDAILLCFGLCGNSVVGLKAGHIPLVIPRAHDCCTIFLGSKEKFLRHFSDKLSAEWSCAGYMERGDDYLRETESGKLLGYNMSYDDCVKKYGEENAKYLWQTLNPEPSCDSLIYIEMPGTEHPGFRKKMEAEAVRKGRELEVIRGDMRLIRALVEGEWNSDEFLVVPPGKTIKAVYDRQEIVSYG